MISVVIPLYNKESLIAETVQSVLSQTFSAFELIVVNDGSTDNSLAVISEISDQRIQVITIENTGVSVARNTGVNHAKYEWVAFLDGDDWWAPTFLEEIVAAIAAHPKQQVFASGRSRVFRNSEERYHNNHLPKEGQTGIVNYFEVIQSHLPLINASNVVLHASLFANNGQFKPGQTKHEDHDLWMRLCASRPVVFINKNLSFYRKTEKNTASQGIFKARDFSMYLDTLVFLKSSLDVTSLGFFKKYYQRFVPLAYLQYKADYSNSELKNIEPKIKELLSSGWYTAVRILGALRAYTFYKLLTGKGK